MRGFGQWLSEIGAVLRPASYTTDLDDAHIVFVMPVFHDADVAAKALRRLRRHHPRSRLVLISDGDEGFPGEEFAQTYGAEYLLGENLYAMRHGGEMIHRILGAYMKAPARWLIRLDSDARMDRRLGRLPTSGGLYGTIGKRSGTVQGGCILLTHDAAERLHRSEVFLRPELRDPARSWGKYSTPENLGRKLEQKRVAYDKALHWGCIEERVPIRSYPEIYSVWKRSDDSAEALSNRDGRYAIVHPDKMETE